MYVKYFLYLHVCFTLYPFIMCSTLSFMQEQYDRKHSNPELFKEGQLVLRKDFTRKKTRGGKLKERFLGPYTISKVLPHGVYEITDGTGWKTRATGGHLKVYREPTSSDCGEGMCTCMRCVFSMRWSFFCNMSM